MKSSLVIYWLSPIALCWASLGFAADTHVVVAHSNLTWSYNGKSSSSDSPILVDDLKIGDIVEVQVPSGPHGFITIKRGAAGSIAEIKDPVIACGDPVNSKPNAVLRELDCGAASKFGVAFKGSLRLEVLSTFKDPVDFYCWVHKAAMPGTLKLKQQAR
jgi:hypothetical protein